MTEYLENGDLYNAINSQQGGRYHWYRMALQDGKPVPNSGMARRVALDVARGLHFLHTKKIVHFVRPLPGRPHATTSPAPGALLWGPPQQGPPTSAILLE